MTAIQTVTATNAAADDNRWSFAERPLYRSAGSVLRL
jgi:hypothetical protein